MRQGREAGGGRGGKQGETHSWWHGLCTTVTTWVDVRPQHLKGRFVRRGWGLLAILHILSSGLIKLFSSLPHIPLYGPSTP